MTAARGVFIHSAEVDRYRYPPDCPFRTERAGATRDLLRSLDLLDGVSRQVPPVAATAEELSRFHDPGYLAALQRVSAGTITPGDLFLGLGTPETPAFRGLWEYTSLAAGGTLTAARLLLSKEVDVAFNPSGGYHHAGPAKAGGFCYLNDLVLACMLLRDADRRVLCLDLDAHHGNGTQDAFWEDPRVMTVSFHESGRTLYPWGGSEDEIGAGPGIGFNINVPLPAGADDDLFRRAFVEVVPPLLEAFCPDAVVLVLGMDMLSTDPLAHLKMTNNAFADAIPLVAATSAPILATGAGGYDVRATVRGWALCWSVLCGAEPESDPTMGMGGVFLGSEEWSAGLRDPHAYAGGPERERLTAEVARVVEHIRCRVFPLHGITG